MEKKRRRTADEGAALVSDFRASGLTQAKYVEQAGITLCALHYWMKRLARKEATEDQGAPVKFVEINSSEKSIGRGHGMGMVTVEIGHAITLNFTTLPHPEYLAELTRAMMSDVPC